MLQNYNRLRQMFLEYLQTQLLDEEPVKLHEPINYIMDLGGKRIRPVAVMIGYAIFKDDVNRVLPLAYAFEMFHNFTLAHDDVMDHADLRRGQPAMHVAYGLNSAILSGDTMLIYSYRYILSLSDNLEVKDKILRIFTQTAIDICAGQQMDMDFENRNDVQLSDYLLMIKLKTAVLLAACLQCGALLAGASEENADHLYSYGLNVGLAFQIQDDVLDLYGDQEGFGKRKGGDILQQKKTFLYLKALELADQKTQTQLISTYHSSNQDEEGKIAKVRATFDLLEVQKYATQLMNELTENANDHLDAMHIEENRLAELKKLGAFLLNRIN